jgi:vanillate monooxygenase ferredoxin subunit
MPDPFKLEYSRSMVITLRDVCADVRAFELSRPPEFVHEPGGHVDVEVLIDGRPKWRSYSVVQVAGDVLIIAVKRVIPSRGGSSYMWGLKAGDPLKLKMAQNSFPVSFRESRHIILAGGIGVTPLIGIARALKKSGKDVRFIYCVRSIGQAPFLKELREILANDLVVHCSDDQGLFLPMELLTSIDPRTCVHMCGPISLMNVVQSCWNKLGLPSENLRFESFGSSGEFGAEAFTVRVSETGASILVPANKTLLDALLDAGQEVMFECRRGECGLCKVDIVRLEGRIDHRDVFFCERERQENRAICCCVSRVSGFVDIKVDGISHGRGT